jgi:hypothetical protein
LQDLTTDDFISLWNSGRPEFIGEGTDISPAEMSGDPAEFYRRLPFKRNPFE